MHFIYDCAAVFAVRRSHFMMIIAKKQKYGLSAFSNCCIRSYIWLFCPLLIAKPVKWSLFSQLILFYFSYVRFKDILFWFYDLFSSCILPLVLFATSNSNQAYTYTTVVCSLVTLSLSLALSLFLCTPSILFSPPPFTQFYYLYNVLLWVLFFISSQGYIRPKIESLLCHNKRRKKTDSLYFTLTTNISGPCRRSTTLVTRTLLYAMCVVR